MLGQRRIIETVVFLDNADLLQSCRRYFAQYEYGERVAFQHRDNAHRAKLLGVCATGETVDLSYVYDPKLKDGVYLDVRQRRSILKPTVVELCLKVVCPLVQMKGNTDIRCNYIA